MHLIINVCICRSEHSQLDQFFSSGSEGGSDGQVPDGEKALSKSKIYPMGRGMLMIVIYKHSTICNTFVINGHAILIIWVSPLSL